MEGNFPRNVSDHGQLNLELLKEEVNFNVVNKEKRDKIRNR